MNGTGKTLLSRNAGIRKHLDAFSLINIPGRVYDPVIGYFTTPDPLIKIPGYSQDFNPYTYTHNNPLSFIDPSGYWDEACDIGGASDPGYNLITYTKELTTDDGTAYKINISTVLADIKAIGSHPLNLKSRGLKGGVPGRDISAELLPGGNMTSNSTGSSGSSGVDNSDFFHNLAIQNTFRGDYVSSVNFNNDLNKTGNSNSENLDKLNGLNANEAKSLAEEGTNGNLVKTISTTNTATGIAVSATQGLLQNTMLGANFTYSIAYNKFLFNSVSNGFYYAPYVSLGVTIYTGYYLSKTINPETNLPYQSWAETGMDIGANIGIIYLGSHYGGWVGGGAAILYVVDKAAFGAYMNSVKKHPDLVLPPLVHSFTH